MNRRRELDRYSEHHEERPCQTQREYEHGSVAQGLLWPMRVAVLEEPQTRTLDFGPWSRFSGFAQIAFYEHLADPDALVERLAAFNAIVTSSSQTVFSRSLLSRLPRLRLLINMGSKTEHIDTAAARELGVTVSGAGAYNPAPPESAWALLLALRRQLAVGEQDIQPGLSEASALFGATLGVIGLEHHEAALRAAIGRAFGMRVLAWSERSDPEMIDAVAAETVTLERLLSASDVVMIDLEADDRTDGLISKAELELLKPTAYLINSSHAAIVDAHALIDALHHERFIGAGLDVSSIEPLHPRHPLREAPRTLLMSEGEYSSATSYRPFYTRAIQNIAAFMEGEPLRVLDPLT